MKTLKIGIASYEDMKARTMAIARGRLKPKAHEPKVWFTSTESFAKVLSNKNRALLAVIAATHPASDGVVGKRPNFFPPTHRRRQSLRRANSASSASTRDSSGAPAMIGTP